MSDKENLKDSLFKEITTETGDCRDEVFQYLDLMEIPDYFYSCMYGELVKIFGLSFIEPSLYDDDGEPLSDLSYCEQIYTMLTLEGGTGGWYSAFKMTCKITGMEKLLEVYISLNWMNSDYFDEYICDHIMTEIFDNTAKCRGDSSYSTYLRKKGWI